MDGGGLPLLMRDGKILQALYAFDFLRRGEVDFEEPLAE